MTPMQEKFERKYLQKDKTELYVPYNKHILYNIKAFIGRAEIESNIEAQIKVLEEMTPHTGDFTLTEHFEWKINKLKEQLKEPKP